MIFRSRFLRVAAALLLLLCLGFLALADTIKLKDGSIVKGKVTGFRDGKFEIQIGEGNRQRKMSFFADEIDTIDFDGTQPASSNSSPSNSSNRVVVTNTIATPTPKPPANSNSNSNSNKNNNPMTTSPPSNSTKKKLDPIKINLKVTADNTANGWTNSGWIVRKGQKIKISGTGRISLGNGRYSTPSGIGSLPENTRLLKDKPTGGIIAVIGDDNNDFIFVGSSIEFTAVRDGALFLGINECDGCLEDNSGAYEVVLEIDPTISN